jgi:uncharacterized protein YybS (DUF2232 family)
MLFLAKAVMQSPNRALLWAFMLGAATIVLSPVGILSGAVIALVTLAAGLQPGVRVLLATLLGGGFASIAFGSLNALLLSGAEFWLPAFFLAVVLGRTRSLSLMIQVATVVLLGSLVAVYLLLASPEAAWLEFVQQLLAMWQAEGIAIEPEASRLLLEQMPRVLTMLVFMGLYVVWLGVLFLARWWQTNLYEAGSLGEQFRLLDLGASLAWLLAALFVAVLFLPEQVLIQDMLGLLTVAFMLQGLAVLHHWVFVRGTGKGWLILVYILLGVLPQMMMLVASLGWMENWTRWRTKFVPDSHS